MNSITKSYKSLAIVKDMEIVSSKAEPVVTVFHPPYMERAGTKYNVYVECEGNTYCINSSELYFSLDIYDVIPVIVTKIYNKNKKLQRMTINLA